MRKAFRIVLKCLKVPPPEDLKDEIELRQDNIDLVPKELERIFHTRERMYS